MSLCPLVRPLLTFVDTTTTVLSYVLETYRILVVRKGKILSKRFYSEDVALVIFDDVVV